MCFNFSKLKKINIKIILTILISFILLITNEAKLSALSEITITINGTGDQKIISDRTFNNTPNQIYVNDILQNYTGYMVYNLKNNINKIRMEWNYTLINCNFMFYHLENIIEIDMSKFDSSKVINMKYMFGGLSTIKSLNLKNFNTSLVTDMNHMFVGCKSLKLLNLKSFKTSLVNNMYYMFGECISLISLDLNNFDTSKVTKMDWMFNLCYALKSLKIKNFNTSLVNNMEDMFQSCKSLIFLDLSSFNVSKVKNMNGMFSGCSSLKFIKITNFDTSRVTDIFGMFSGCSSLIYLNLNDLNTTNVIEMNYMFSGCNSLKLLNLKNIDTSKIREYYNDYGDYDYNDDMFLNINTNLIYCINTNKASDLEQLLTGNNKDCSHNCFLNSSYKFIIDTFNCIDECYNDLTYKYEYNNLCYETCPNGTHISSNHLYLCEEDLICDEYYNYDYTEYFEELSEGYYLNDSMNKIIDKCNIKCKNCSLESNTYNLCISCNTEDNYYPKYNDSLNKNSFINCYNITPERHILDNNIYKPCYETCYNCKGIGENNNHNCISCITNYSFIHDNNDNCYKNCEYYYYFDNKIILIVLMKINALKDIN